MKTYIININISIPSQPLTLERTHMYSVDNQLQQVSIIQVRNGNNISTAESNGNNNSNGITSIVNLQRSPSVGSRPSSMTASQQQLNSKVVNTNSLTRPEKPPRPDLPEQIRSHSRTRSEGNIIDVHTQTETVVVPRSLHHHHQQQQQPASPRFLQRPPRPQPPPPPPPFGVRPKSDNESTNL